MKPGKYLVLSEGVVVDDRVVYAAGDPIPFDEARRLRLLSEDEGGGAGNGAPAPSHSSVPGRKTRPSPAKVNPHPRPDKESVE